MLMRIGNLYLSHGRYSISPDPRYEWIVATGLSVMCAIRSCSYAVIHDVGSLVEQDVDHRIESSRVNHHGTPETRIVEQSAFLPRHQFGYGLV